MKARDLVKLLEKHGWYQVRQAGSHRVFKHPENPATLSVPDHGKKDIRIGTLNALLKQAGLK